MTSNRNIEQTLKTRYQKGNRRKQDHSAMNNMMVQKTTTYTGIRQPDAQRSYKSYHQHNPQNCATYLIKNLEEKMPANTTAFQALYLQRENGNCCKIPCNTVHSSIRHRLPLMWNMAAPHDISLQAASCSQW
jgi:hypothetical protein